MTLLPYPSQDVAKLVLGYLAEEQLMTAYDEFLQASPYLDALTNEYDRVFMTSLKTVLAEYRAVKLYVETCKPFELRKKLLQCKNLLEVMEQLVNLVDINKLQANDKDRSSQNKSTTSKQNPCEVCSPVGLAGCMCRSNKQFKSDVSHLELSRSVCACRSKPYNSSMHSVSHVESRTLESLMEVTALETLPGNHGTTRRRHARTLERVSKSSSNLSIYGDSNKQFSTGKLSSNSQEPQANANENSMCHLSIVKATDTPECGDKIEEFNNILNSVCNNNSNANLGITQSDNLESSVSNASLPEFSTGIRGHDNRNVPVPDSSTSDNSNVQNFVKENTTNDASSISNEVTKTTTENSIEQIVNNYPYPRIKPKTSDQKIKIISDIKVDNPFTAMNNATSTPLMQTIVINGTPAYKPKPVVNNNYTKDEIMAMPTIIVVPTSAPQQKYTQTQPVLSAKVKKVKTKTVSSAKLLRPLVIDVSSSPVPINENNSSCQSGINKQSGMNVGLVKTVDITKNASVPKDNIIAGSTQTKTPPALPPIRKSSSTPRRNSHIRVLDFTTPRRILHETNETIPEEINNKCYEIVVTKSPNVTFPGTTGDSNIIDMTNVTVHKIESCLVSNLKENSNIKPVLNKKLNWDADLRSLATCGEKSTNVTVKKRRIRDKKNLRKCDNAPKNSESTDTDKNKSRGKRKSSPKGKKSKRRKLEEEEDQYNQTVKDNETIPAVKPIFNIVTADSQENTKAGVDLNKSNAEDINETPETERISLQNEIGAKLNISDLLETPYKQALYDIQMDTPKLLGSILPDEPISDIKIMNIPTPRFFDTPKHVQATPSYSSRGTDYSSGGSYYKPDEQDYIRIPDLECAVTSSKQELNILPTKDNENVCKKYSRPVRSCTKNISYKAHSSKGKGTEDKLEESSACSDSISLNSSFEKCSKDNIKTPKTPKNKSKIHPKSDAKKVINSGKKRNSPFKRDKSNTFMKIKPRQPTPIKENNKLNRKKTTLAQKKTPGSLSKKRTNGKTKTIYSTPIVTCAPTKSRRKSSTPRKLHCTKQFNSESSVSPEMNVVNTKIKVIQNQNLAINQESDTEQLALRWSDDGSQDSKLRASECEDISKIKEYIESSTQNKINYDDVKGTLQVDLIKRGFDVETAKIIERDLLDTPTDFDRSQEDNVQTLGTKAEESSEEKIKNRDISAPNDSENGQDSEDDIQLSVCDCDEDSANYITCISEAKDAPNGSPVRLKETWNMEIFLDDSPPIRLRATKFNMLCEVCSTDQNVETSYSFTETEVAVASILEVDKLNTPLKDRRSQCYDIFDSTLTSLDTPLKLVSPKHKVHETTQIEITVEEEEEELKDKSDIKNKKSSPDSFSSEESLNENSKTKPETPYLFNSTNIQNIDIESVLQKLHGS